MPPPMHNITWPAKKVRVSVEDGHGVDGDTNSSDPTRSIYSTFSVIVATQTTTSIITAGAGPQGMAGGPMFDGGNPESALSQQSVATSAILTSLITDDPGTNSEVLPSVSSSLFVTGDGTTHSPESTPITWMSPDLPPVTQTLSAVPTISSSAATTPLHASTYTLTKAASSIPTTTSAPSEIENAHSTITPIVAGVVPAVLIIVGIIIFTFWWRHRGNETKQKNKSNGLDNRIHDESRSDSSTETKANVFGEQGVQSDASLIKNFHSALPLMRNQSRPAPKDRPSSITLPQTILRDAGPSNKLHITNPDLSIDIEDPFLTPTSQETFPSTALNSSSLFGDSSFRPSQIGLAVTTPPSHHNKSTSSLADSDEGSTGTVIHDAQLKTFSRLTDFPTAQPSHVGAISLPKRKPIRAPQPSQIATRTSVQTDIQNLEPVVTALQSQDRPSHPTNASQASIPKSNTPPEELARRWIQVLQMEAAQAQEAAEDAAKRAKELRRKQIGKERSGAGEAE